MGPVSYDLASLLHAMGDLPAGGDWSLRYPNGSMNMNE